MGAVSSVDRVQRRHTVLGFPLAVIYKFFDDQGNWISAAITYYAFVAIFPLLLLASSIFGFVLQGNPHLQDEVLNSALGQFPIIGEQLGRPEGLRGSTSGIVVGTLAALYGALGLGQAIQNLMAVAWAIPRNSRPNPILLRLKSLVLLSFAGIAVIGISTLSALGSNTEVFGKGTNGTIRFLILVATIVVIGLVLTGLFRFAAAHSHHVSRAAPGAFTVAVLWQALQWVGTYYATHVLAGPSALNKTFGLVLGLIAIIYVAAMMTVMGVEVNVVLARRLWPRALLTPFTDSVDLTDADRRAYAMYTQMQRHKGFQTVAVRFDGRDGGTHEIVLHPQDPKPVVRSTPPTGEIALPPSGERPWTVPAGGTSETRLREQAASRAEDLPDGLPDDPDDDYEYDDDSALDFTVDEFYRDVQPPRTVKRRVLPRPRSAPPRAEAEELAEPLEPLEPDPFDDVPRDRAAGD